MEKDFATIFELAVSQGIWAVLYIYLFFRMLRDKGDGSFCPIYLHKVNISVDIYPPCLYTDIR